MSDKCPYCGADVRECLSTLKTYNCNTKHSLFSEEWVYWQSVECKECQIANLQASRDRWKGLALLRQPNHDETLAIAALKQAGEWEE